MSGIVPSYPKIFHLGDAMIANLFKGSVEITEKIDGSQWCFGIDADGNFGYRSKNQDLSHGEVPNTFEGAKEQMERIENILKDNNFRNIFFYAEFLRKEKHNLLKYNRIPKNHLYLFGVLNKGEFVYNSFQLMGWAEILDIEPANVRFVGDISNIDDLYTLLDVESILGGTKMEGIVIKNYNEPSGRGSWIQPISLGKFVREEFKERQNKDWKKEFTSKGKLDIFLDSFNTDARKLKAIQHLRDQGLLENTPKDIGELMREIHRDIIEEESENIKEELFKLYIKDIVRYAQRGLPDMYKQMLAEASFEELET
ncbi:MAG: RNA ligase family protein [Phycisphaerae bacterium]|jgi:hypothetical protein